jgi:hypothetical protein
MAGRSSLVAPEWKDENCRRAVHLLWACCLQWEYGIGYFEAYAFDPVTGSVTGREIHWGKVPLFATIAVSLGVALLVTVAWFVSHRRSPKV